mgnify:CR=1 FL=1
MQQPDNQRSSQLHFSHDELQPNTIKKPAAKAKQKALQSKQNVKKKLIILILTIIIVISVLIGTSYAVFFNVDKADNISSYTTGLLQIEKTSGSDISLLNTLPMQDSDGEVITPSTYVITNTGNLTYSFNIKLLATATEQGGADCISAINTIRALGVKIDFDNNKFTKKFVQGGLSGNCVKPVAMYMISEKKNRMGKYP